MSDDDSEERRRRESDSSDDSKPAESDGERQPDDSGTDSIESEDDTDETAPDTGGADETATQAVDSDLPEDGSPVQGDRAPLADLSDAVRQRRQQREPEDAELFEEIDISEVDTEQLWDEVTSESAEADVESVEEAAIGAGSEVEVVEPGDDERRPEYILPKDEFCERCPYLSAPPELSCGHEGTEIVEVTDVEHFRVRACPFAEQETEYEDVVRD